MPFRQGGSEYCPIVKAHSAAPLVMREHDPSKLTGGCQCGAVRYAVGGPVEMVHYCHCRMCQRALGNLFGVFAGAPDDLLVWTRGEPRQFASSSMASRGFCGHCGTPLSIRYRDSRFTYLTIGSFDHPEQIRPEQHYGTESQLPWLTILDSLPRAPTPDDPRYLGMQVHQHPFG